MGNYNSIHSWSFTRSNKENTDKTNPPSGEKKANCVSSNRLTDHMIRERHADVFSYYQDIRQLGEGSIGSVRLVRRKKGTVGGSAYDSQRDTANKEGTCGCLIDGVFGCSWLGMKNKAARRGGRHISESSKSVNSNHTEIFALKSIQLRLVKKEYLDELRNEVSVLRSLDHPNIVKAYEVYETKQNIYVVMEYCSGGNLYARIPYMESQSANIITQLCSAIAHMHNHGIIHRDIKMENIMFESKEPTAEIKVLDFGLSKKFIPGMYMTDWVGTVYTMSPQVLQGVYTNKADCWSIGVIAFLLLCNEKPFAGKRSEMLSKIKRCDYNFKSPGWYNVSNEATRFVTALLTKDPTKRLSAEEALRHPWITKKSFSSVSVDKLNESLLMNVKGNILSYAQTSELKKIAAVIVAHKSSVQEIIDMRRAFEKFDKSKDGVITVDEFKSAMELCDEYSDEEVNAMFDQLNVNHNGHIMYTEFIAATLEIKGRVEEKRLAEAFDHIDDDDSGYISKGDLRKLLGERATSEKIDKLIEEADTDGDGQISFDEFLVMYRKNNALAVKKEIITKHNDESVDVSEEG
jgi:serine/threonine protein kinase